MKKIFSKVLILSVLFLSAISAQAQVYTFCTADERLPRERGQATKSIRYFSNVFEVESELKAHLMEKKFAQFLMDQELDGRLIYVHCYIAVSSSQADEFKRRTLISTENMNSFTTIETEYDGDK